MSLHSDPTTIPSARCPSCGARNSADAVWCSLCFCSMSEPPAPRADDQEPRAQEVGAQEVGAQEVGAQGAPPPVDALLAELAAGEGTPPRWSAATGLVSSPGARVAVMLLGTVLVTGLGFAVMAAVGALL